MFEGVVIPSPRLPPWPPDSHSFIPASTAILRFAEVCKAYEVLSDEKRRREYNMKLKFTSPFGRGTRSGSSGATGRRRESRTGSSSYSTGSAYNPAREEASRKWREDNPTPDQIGEREIATYEDGVEFGP